LVSHFHDVLETHRSSNNPYFSVSSGYDPVAADKAVHFFSIISNRRFFYILSTIWALVSFNMWQSKAQGNVDKGKAMACRIRKSLIGLGVTFIKLGQFLSMRPDILPVQLIEELSLLQDQVPPFSFAEVKVIVERELGKSLQELFGSFESECIASASIGQVHKAFLRDGTALAVKVQRPGLAKIIYQDLGFMRLIARLGKACHWQGDWQAWLELTDDFGHSLFVEMNYLQEGRHADRLRKILRPIPAIIIPRIIWRLTTKKILTEELQLGTKIDNGTVIREQAIDLKRLCTQLVDAYLLQIFVHGYFHADPHAGNFAVTKTGQLIIYDFGMISFLTSRQRQGLINAITSIVNNDSQALVASLEELGIVAKISQESKNSLKKTIQPFLDFCQTSSATEINLSELEKEMDQLVKKQSLRLPANLAYLIRAVVSLEGFVRMLNPEFNFVRAAKPYFKPLVLKRMQLVGARFTEPAV
jgi:predicted unusual protein kinase regulating ubiquinone biosynthesis (AarF/ABC1/UbiB family)